MDTRKRIFASEREMHAAWMRLAGRCIRTCGGEDVRIVYPGIPAGSAGPDFTDAVVVFPGGGLVRGDVELHLHAADWRRHGHDTDHEYDRVVLHVVGDRGSCDGTVLASGHEAPLALLDAGGHPFPEPLLPCRSGRQRDATVTRDLLSQAGIARLLRKAGAASVEMADSAPWLSLARKTARALGYSANTGAATELGLRVTAPGTALPLMWLDDADRTALLLGAAGLLPSQRRLAGLPVGGETARLESAWRERAALVSPVDPLPWRMSGLYPNNSPVRRVVALAELWPRFQALAETSLGLIRCVDGKPSRIAAALEAQLRVTGRDYWRSHYDFGLRTRESDLLGGSKAREIVVNALLPHAAAAAMLFGDASGLSSVVRLLSAYPPSPAHAITRHMRRQLGVGAVIQSAAAQQGLVHVFHEHCRKGLCARCPLGEERMPVMYPLPAEAPELFSGIAS